MADIATLRTYLRDPIGLWMDVAGTSRANAVIQEGIGSIDDLVDLNYDKGIKTICMNVRKPAGMILDPNWIAPAINPGALVAPQATRPGSQLPAICEQRLTNTAYGASMYHSINRPIYAWNITRARLREFNQHKEMVENHQ